MLLGSVLATGLAVASDFRVNLVPVAALRSIFDGGTCACGDADGDGWNEIYGAAGEDQWPLRIYEHQGDNRYALRPSAVTAVRVHDCGYADDDNLFDLAVFEGSHNFAIYESRARDSFPSVRIWGGTTNSVRCIRITDLDRDNKREITVSGSSGEALLVFESRGNNAFEQVPFPARLTTGQFAVGDFDLDSLTELVAGNGRGNVIIYECTGDDQYAVVDSFQIDPMEYGTYSIASANDMDTDGRPEFIVTSCDHHVTPDDMVVRVFESPANDSYLCVWTTRIPHYDERCVACGDVDGDGIDEFGISAMGVGVRLFKCNGPDSYEEVWSVNQPMIHAIQFFDANGNGRDELCFSAADSTRLYEDTTGLSAFSKYDKATDLRPVSIAPTVSRQGSPLQFTGLPPNASVEIHDALGRLVARSAAIRSDRWLWDLRDAKGLPVSAGTYIAAVRSPQQSASLKLCVIR